MSTVLFTPAAQSDIENIWNYTIAQWGETQAIKYLQEISIGCIAISTKERPSYSAEDIRTGYQKFYINAHVVFFKINHSNDMEVIRILHQQMDAGRHI